MSVPPIQEAEAGGSNEPRNLGSEKKKYSETPHKSNNTLNQAETKTL